MKIIVDAMGGDNAPQAPVMGAIQANQEYGVGITLVGRGEEILKVLEENGIKDLPAGVEIAHASEVVEMCDNPATAFREKKDSSLTVGLNLLKSGAGDAFVSAGSTGALLSDNIIRHLLVVVFTTVPFFKEFCKEILICLMCIMCFNVFDFCNQFFIFFCWFVLSFNESFNDVIHKKTTSNHSTKTDNIRIKFFLSI